MHINSVVTEKCKESPFILQLLQQFKPFNAATMPKGRRGLFHRAIKMVSYNTLENREHLILIPEQMSMESPTPYPGNWLWASGAQEKACTAGIIAQ